MSESHQVVAAVLLDGGRVMLCHRSPTRQWFPNAWDFPGGHVEDGESSAEALRREMLEEMGVDVGTVEYGPVLRLTEGDIDLSVWAVRQWSGDAENRQLEEHDEIGWFRSDELATLLFADDRYLPFLRDLLRDEQADGSPSPSR